MSLGFVGFGRDKDHGTVLPGGDKTLGTINHVTVAVLYGCGGLSHRIRPRIGFGQGKRSDDLPGGQGHKKLLLLFFCAEFIERFAHNGILDRHHHGGRRAGICDLGQGQHVGNSICSFPAKLFGYHHTHQPKLPHLF